MQEGRLLGRNFIPVLSRFGDQTNFGRGFSLVSPIFHHRAKEETNEKEEGGKLWFVVLKSYRPVTYLGRTDSLSFFLLTPLLFPLPHLHQTFWRRLISTPVGFGLLFLSLCCVLLVYPLALPFYLGSVGRYLCCSLPPSPPSCDDFHLRGT